MYRSVYDLKTFYNSAMGQTVQRILLERILEFWPDVHGLRVMGCGYATPYLDNFCEKAERVIAMMPSGQGADMWPKERKNLVFLSDGPRLPIENASVDRILLMHHLECCDHLQSNLHELWRVLKANGRLLVIVPNRAGFWARSDWSPFGHGSPFSLTQLCFYLRDNLFVQERVQGALFTPPMQYSLIIKSSGFFEKMGRTIIPIVSGVHMIEASKQIYAGVDKGTGSKAPVTPSFLGGGRPPAVPVPQNYSTLQKIL